jgi:hypothetical protein
MICRLGRETTQWCPRKEKHAWLDECLSCRDDLDERAAHCAHHRGLASPPLSREESMGFAVELVRERLPGQKRLL